jgi:nicotinamide-nucleotide amidase
VRTAELLAVVPDPARDPLALGALAARLDREGLPLRGRRTLPPDEAAVGRALGEAAAGGGLVVAVGEGDGAAVLRGALARLTGGRLVLSDRALEALAEAYAARDRAMPRRAESLALVPQGATVLVVAGGEPGLLAEVGGTPVAVLPAAPAAALALLADHVLPRVARRDGEAVVARTLRVVAADPAPVEAQVGDALRGAEGVTAHVAGGEGEVAVRLLVRAPTPAAALARWQAVEPPLRGALGPAWYGEDDASLEDAVGRLLRARGLTVALAESCTGGLVGHRLTQVPGSSAYVERGFLVYSNAAKEALLGVPSELLRAHGAVSAACAEAMARGARARGGTHLGLAVTGIAGPDGGTPAKPVGTVFVALADGEGAWSHRYRFDRDRAGNKALSAVMALDALRRYCLGGLAGLEA